MYDFLHWWKISYQLSDRGYMIFFTSRNRLSFPLFCRLVLETSRYMTWQLFKLKARKSRVRHRVYLEREKRKQKRGPSNFSKNVPWEWQRFCGSMWFIMQLVIAGWDEWKKRFILFGDRQLLQTNSGNRG